MKIALAQTNPTIGAFAENVEKMRSMVDQAKDEQSDLIVFSELIISGYPPMDLLDRADFVNENIRHLHEVIGSINDIGVICGFVDKNPSDGENALHNSAVLFENGRILYQVHKRLLPNYDVFDENRYFKPGQAVAPFAYRGHKLGLTICEDVWNDEDLYPKDVFARRRYPVDPVAEVVERGADLIINISSSPYWMGKGPAKHDMLSQLAKKHAVPLLYVNQTGGNDSLLFDGVSMAFDSAGEMVARARDFEEDLVFFHTDSQKGTIHPVSRSVTATVLKALITGTGDYVQKCGFSKVLVGLSGGIDSALTAAVAVKALGKKNVTGVFMPSPFTSSQTGRDTETLATNLDIELLRVPIDKIFEASLGEMVPLLGDIKTTVTGQNIQARLRGVILMALSNSRGALVLTTGNKSELAVGYCTLYGDMVGALAVIADVPKTLVYELAQEINAMGTIIPQPILDKAPSAELIPGQADSDDLPPYPVLDKISQAYIEKNLDPDTIASMGPAPAVVSETIARIDRNEYKRYQSPPTLKVTTKSFGYGRRYPIARKYAWQQHVPK